MTNQAKSIIEPDLTDVLINFKKDIFLTMNCIKMGSIVSFDPSKKTAVVKILLKRILTNGTFADYQQLLDVPVVTLQGGGGAIQFPITAGDQCLLFFNDRCIDQWFEQGQAAAPYQGRMHDMSDAFALVGVNAMNSPLPTYPTDRVVLMYKGSKFELTATGWNFVGDGGAEIDLAGEIVTIKNATTTLLTLINGFITLLEGIQVTGPLALTPAFIATLEAYKAQFATLLG